jgi:C4-dicarboxylate-binding protein DctP
VWFEIGKSLLSSRRNNERDFPITTLGAVFAGLLVCASAPFAQAAEPMTLRLTLQLPITSHLGVNLAQFKDEVEKLTNKAILIDIIDNSRAFKDNEVIDAVSSGKIEMGTVALSQFAQKAPSTQLFEQPFLFNFEALTRAASQPGSEIRTLIDSEIQKNTGIQVLWWQSYGYSVFYTRGRPVDEIAGMQSMKVRAPGDIMRDFVDACGGVPTVISASKQNEALQDGTVDAAVTSIEGVEPRALWKVTDTVTRTENAAFNFVVMINGKVWQSLTDEHKAVLTKAALKVEKDLWDNMESIEEKSYEFARSKNMKIVTLTTNQLAQWRGCSAKVFENFLTSYPEISMKMMAAYAKLRTDPCCNHQPDQEFRRH